MEEYLSDEQVFLLINQLRSNMIEIGLSKGLNHPETIACSQKLDELINQYLNNSSSKSLCNQK